GESQRIAGVMAQNLINQLEGFTAILAGEAPDVPMGAHDAFPLPELGGILAPRSLNLGSDDSGSDGTDNAACDLVLNGKDVLQGAVVALGPDMVAARRVDELRGDAHAVAGFADAAFEHVAHAEIAADFAHVERLALVAERRIAGDDEQPMRLGQRRDDVLSNAVGKEILLDVAAHILEREHRNRRFIWQRQAAGSLDAGGWRLGTELIDAHRSRNILKLLLA